MKSSKNEQGQHTPQNTNPSEETNDEKRAAEIVLKLWKRKNVSKAINPKSKWNILRNRRTTLMDMVKKGSELHAQRNKLLGDIQGWFARMNIELPGAEKKKATISDSNEENFEACAMDLINFRNRLRDIIESYDGGDLMSDREAERLMGWSNSLKLLIDSIEELEDIKNRRHEIAAAELAQISNKSIDEMSQKLLERTKETEAQTILTSKYISHLQNANELLRSSVARHKMMLEDMRSRMVDLDQILRVRLRKDILEELEDDFARKLEKERAFLHKEMKETLNVLVNAPYSFEARQMGQNLLYKYTGRDDLRICIIVGDQQSKEIQTSPLPVTEFKGPTGKVTFLSAQVSHAKKLWNNHYACMKKSMSLTTEIFLQLLKELNGYNAKADDYEFLFVFQNTRNAVDFAVQSQLSLLKAQWPEELLSTDFGKEVQASDGTIVNRGLRVRMGIHVGVPIVQTNYKTFEPEYCGNVVTSCRGLKEIAQESQILMSGTAFDELLSDIDQLVCPISYYHLGEYALGNGEKEHVVEIVPKSLPQRKCKEKPKMKFATLNSATSTSDLLAKVKDDDDMDIEEDDEKEEDIDEKEEEEEDELKDDELSETEKDPSKPESKKVKSGKYKKLKEEIKRLKAMLREKERQLKMLKKKTSDQEITDPVVRLEQIFNELENLEDVDLPKHLLEKIKDFTTGKKMKPKENGFRKSTPSSLSISKWEDQGENDQIANSEYQKQSNAERMEQKLREHRSHLKEHKTFIKEHKAGKQEHIFATKGGSKERRSSTLSNTQDAKSAGFRARRFFDHYYEPQTPTTKSKAKMCRLDPKKGDLPYDEVLAAELERLGVKEFDLSKSNEKWRIRRKELEARRSEELKRVLKCFYKIVYEGTMSGYFCSLWDDNESDNGGDICQKSHHFDKSLDIVFEKPTLETQKILPRLSPEKPKSARAIDVQTSTDFEPSSLYPHLLKQHHYMTPLLSKLVQERLSEPYISEDELTPRPPEDSAERRSRFSRPSLLFVRRSLKRTDLQKTVGAKHTLIVNR